MCPLHSFSSSLLSITTGYSRQLVLSLPHPGRPVISPRSPGSFYCLVGFRNQDLCSRCGHCAWSVTASKTFQQTESGKKHVFVCMNTCACAHIDTYFIPMFPYFSYYRCIYTHMFTLIHPPIIHLIVPLPAQHHKVYLVFCLSIFETK